jgi:2-methylisocitrate lyase-like PEP mutase family enzyme
MGESAGRVVRDQIAQGRVVPFVGVYDVFSASVAGRHFEDLFVSGFCFAASHYGLPDLGFVSWSDLVGFVQRLRAVLPRQRLLVDIDDGFGDAEVAAHVVHLLRLAGAAGVVIEDQKRPRRCGHYDGKQLLPVADYVDKLKQVLAVRGEMCVVARTDASDPAEIEQRAAAFAEAGADVILVDAVPELERLKALRQRVGRPFAFNQILGGKTPPCSLTQLAQAGVSVAVYSTPCLFAAHRAVDRALQALKDNDGLLGADGVDLQACTNHLNENLAQRSSGPQS